VKKILFLDIDGVVNSQEFQLKGRKDSGLLGIDPLLAFTVGRIILNTDCLLVISSSWRNWPDGIKQIKSQIYPDIYGTTPYFSTKELEFEKDGVLDIYDVTRGREVEAWLNEHKEELGEYKYAILDDDDDFLPNQPLFKTRWKTGITEEIAKAVTDYLNS
jgi:hypothetical protein